MAPPLQSLEYWRVFFHSAQASIFDAIAAAIRVAAADHPDGLRARRDAIAQHLYTVLPPSEKAVLAAPAFAGPPPPLLPEGVVSLGSSDGPAVAPHRDSDDPVVAEAFRVKVALSRNKQKSEGELLDLLRRLQLLKFTVDTIRVTEIVKAVMPLCKNASKKIRQLARLLVEGWQAKVNEWMNNEAAIADHTPRPMDPSCLEQEEGGLPCPPMDEAALFATPCTFAELSEFFNGIDDDGNIILNAKEDGGQQYPTNKELVKRHPPMGQQVDPKQNCRLDHSVVRQSQLPGWQTRYQSTAEAQRTPSNAAFGPGRPPRLHSEPVGRSIVSPKQREDISVAQTQRRPKSTMPNHSSTQCDQNSDKAKLDLTKNTKLDATTRKLQESYQEVNDAKKQRAIKMLDPQDLPKQGRRRYKLDGKPRNNSASNIRNRIGGGHVLGSINYVSFQHGA